MSGSCVQCATVTKYDEKNPKITCHGCSREFCTKCSGLLATELRVVVLQNPKLRFLCPDCEEGLKQVPILQKRLFELEGEVKKLKSKQSATECESTIGEIHEREKRSRNVIMFGVGESSSEDPNERQQHDKKEITAILSKVASDISIERAPVIRLGKPNSNKPRPIKIILKSRESALEILRSQKKLMNSKIRIKSDLTPMQREYLRSLGEQLEERRKKGERDITIKYVRGVPKIINIPKNL